MTPFLIKSWGPEETILKSGGLLPGSRIFDVMFLVGFFQVYTITTNLMLTKGLNEKIVNCRREESERRF